MTRPYKSAKWIIRSHNIIISIATSLVLGSVILTVVLLGLKLFNLVTIPWAHLIGIPILAVLLAQVGVVVITVLLFIEKLKQDPDAS